MNDGTISGNTSSMGGGVSVGTGTFTMKGGTISGNTATGTLSMGGGVYILNGTFRIVTGTVYGSSAGALSNTATSNGAALFNSGTAQRGTFSGETWNSNGNLITSSTYTNNTISVLNGDLQ